MVCHAGRGAVENSLGAQKGILPPIVVTVSSVEMRPQTCGMVPGVVTRAGVFLTVADTVVGMIL